MVEVKDVKLPGCCRALGLTGLLAFTLSFLMLCASLALTVFAATSVSSKFNAQLAELSPSAANSLMEGSNSLGLPGGCDADDFYFLDPNTADGFGNDR